VSRNLGSVSWSALSSVHILCNFFGKALHYAARGYRSSPLLLIKRSNISNVLDRRESRKPIPSGVQPPYAFQKCPILKNQHSPPPPGGIIRSSVSEDSTWSRASPRNGLRQAQYPPFWCAIGRTSNRLKDAVITIQW